MTPNRDVNMNVGRAPLPLSNFELYAWLFMRLSGVVLLGLAVFHLLWMHFAIGVENINFNTVVGRWKNPLWRLYDLFLLVFALTHGANGARMVLDDYLSRRPAWRVAAKSLLLLSGVVLLGMGGYVIFTFQAPAPVDLSAGR